MPTGTGLPLCHEYICRGGSCQEHRGIMFLMAIPVALCLRNNGSQTPDRWLKLARNIHSKTSIICFNQREMENSPVDCFRNPPKRSFARVQGSLEPCLNKKRTSEWMFFFICHVCCNYNLFYNLRCSQYRTYEQRSRIIFSS